jgi:cell pole-organizing protein PopZ
MEEILASIRRIISEEEKPAAPVLNLTQPELPAAAPAQAVEDDIVFEAIEQAAAADRAPQPEPPALAPAAPPPEAPVAEPPAAVIEGTILSSPTASATAGALARLAGSLRVSDVPGQSLESIVRELLKPMLKEWLECNLPAIVEARVEAELERISRLAR